MNGWGQQNKWTDTHRQTNKYETKGRGTKTH